jgi:hypothetical protein
MKYTRYDMKKKKNEGAMVLLILAVTLIMAFIIGTVMSNFFLKSSVSGKSDNNTKKTISQESSSKTAETNNVIKYVVIQGGNYKNKDYLESCKTTLSNYGNPFTIPESDTTRVLLGIYNEADSEKLIKTLNENKVDNSKMVLEISNGDLCNKEIVEIINGNLLMLTKLTEKNVPAVQTDEFKKWCTSLKDAEKDSKNYASLAELKTYVNNMPEKIVKEKAADNYVFLYNILKKLSVK